MRIAELDTEDDSFVWAFTKDSNGNLMLYNKDYDAYMYNKKSGATTYVLADKAADASAYQVSVDNDKKALVITDGSNYLYNSNGTARIYKTASYWKLELIGTAEGSLTSIVEVETEANTPAVIEGIFDLTGRKIDEITKPGLYIINGKKVLVK
jgi:hypothetical protein